MCLQGYSRFSCADFGSGFLVKVWFVFIMLTLEVTPWIASMLHFLVSQDSAQELFRHTIAPYLGVSRIDSMDSIC